MSNRNWKNNLKPSAIEFIEQIIEQVPEAHGARDTFTVLLDQIAGDKPMFQYLVLGEDGDVSGGTSNEDLRDYIVDNTEDLVINCWLSVKELTGADYYGFGEEEEEDGE